MTTTLTMRLVKGDFIVTGPDVEPMKFKRCCSGDTSCSPPTSCVMVRATPLLISSSVVQCPFVRRKGL
jgi:hypothetical protein